MEKIKQTVNISDIQYNDSTQIRTAIDHDVVERYAEIMSNADSSPFPPILIYRDENNILWLADGHHRLEASLKLGKLTIEAFINDGSKDDALWVAIKANGKNGLSLNRKDIRKAIEIALRTFPQKSMVEISKAIGTSTSTVCNIRDELEAKGELNRTEKTIGKDGKERPKKYCKNKKNTPDSTHEKQPIQQDSTQQEQLTRIGLPQYVDVDEEHSTLKDKIVSDNKDSKNQTSTNNEEINEDEFQKLIDNGQADPKKYYKLRV
ncbi:MAG: ParB/RepB/Spo0J family partition protein [Planctomycetaceae bacterium]|jgi:ParB-like chromosome segregation protein Spo0J|nr:ParB/RepB/Spo0J family partition protein [Planctomycetaceae bacterium]